MHQVTVENLDWAVCVERYDRPHTLFYLDPPYWGTEGYGVEFGFAQYERMAELLRSMAGKALVSVNDIPEMRSAFAGLEMKTLPIRYTVGGQGRARPSSELLISNYPA